MPEVFGFFTDTVLLSDAICNLKTEQMALLKSVENGQRVVIFGRRNTGKTSLVKSVVIANFQKNYTSSLAIFVDFLGVKDLDDIEIRLRIALQDSLAKAFPTQEKLRAVAELLKNIRPQMSIDALTGEASFTITSTSNTKKIRMDELFETIALYHRKNRALLVMDEFQDIALVQGAQAKLRTLMQNLPNDLPIIVLGSKKHLLSKIFAAPKAPFANWGRDLEIPPIKTSDYHPYIQMRFDARQLQISPESVRFLQDQMNDIPESINLICQEVMNDSEISGEIGPKQLSMAINRLLENRNGRFEEYLTTFTSNEIHVLRAISLSGPIKSPSSKAFLAASGVSSAGVLKIIKTLENDAILYRMPEGYILADPLLAKYLIRFRVGVDG